MKKKLKIDGGISSLNSNTFFHSKRKNPLMRILTLGGIMGTLLFTSCSDNSEIVDMETEAKIAQKSEFTLVPAESAATEIKVKLTENVDSFKTTEAPGIDRGRFNITLKYLVPVTDRQKEVFQSAAARWERIIIKDIPSISGEIPSAFVGFPSLTEDGPIDDIVIEVVLAPIDGPGGVLGQAGPRYARFPGGTTISGLMYFDVDDLEFLESLDLFEDVIVHEMGHVLGVGTLWNYNKTLRQGPTTNPYFTGRMANVFWKAEGGKDFLPVENMGGPGTAGGHWREAILKNELMTGYLNLGVNPLSRITAGSMSDLGYGTASVGEQYELERGAPGVDINEYAKSRIEGGLNIAEMEVLLEPVGVVIIEE